MKKVFIIVSLILIFLTQIPIQKAWALQPCDPTKIVACNDKDYLSKKDTPPDAGYPMTGSNCGCSYDSQGNEVQDCFNRTENLCHQPALRGEEPTCGPNSAAIFDLNLVNNGVYFSYGAACSAFLLDYKKATGGKNLPTCCSVDPNANGSYRCALTPPNTWEKFSPLNYVNWGNFLNDQWKNDLQSYCKAVYDAIDKKYYPSTCIPPSFARPNPLTGGNSCYIAPNAGWISHLTACGSNMGVLTAIGCIPTDNLAATLSFLFKWVLGAAGGILLLMLIGTGYSLMTSAGDPQKLQAVKENLVSLFSGLVLIVFSLLLLKAIGANVLGLPGF